MDTVNIHAAKTHLSKLVARAAQGETIVIARDGRPAARLMPLEDGGAPLPRIGFMAGEFVVPEDFDTMHAAQIEQSFSGDGET